MSHTLRQTPITGVDCREDSQQHGVQVSLTSLDWRLPVPGMDDVPFTCPEAEISAIDDEFIAQIPKRSAGRSICR